jgi:hypothetical protein
MNQDEPIYLMMQLEEVRIKIAESKKKRGFLIESDVDRVFIEKCDYLISALNAIYANMMEDLCDRFPHFLIEELIYQVNIKLPLGQSITLE